MKAKLWSVLVSACLLMAACGVVPGKTPAPLATVVLGESTGSPTAGSTPLAGNNESSSGISASGTLVPNQVVYLAFTPGGRVKAVNFQVGQQVKAGDVLVELEDGALKVQLEQAKLNLDELTSPMAVASAQKAVAEAQSSLNGAQGTYNWWLDTKYNEGLLEKAKADLIIAQGKYDDAREDYEDTHGDLTDEKKAAAYQRMYDAEQALKQVQYKYDLYAGADPYQLAIDKAAVEVAQAKLAEEQTLLAALTGGELPEMPTGTGYALLQQAKLNLTLAQINLEQSSLVSPIDGVVAEVNTAAGDYTPPGQTQVVVLNPGRMHVETSDLSERDIPNIRIGQAVSVTIKPINETVTGTVSAISPLADSLGGDVVYQVMIQLDSQPAGALAGMSVVVYFNKLLAA